MEHSTSKKQGPKEETLKFLRKFAREYQPERKDFYFSFGLPNGKELALC